MIWDHANHWRMAITGGGVISGELTWCSDGTWQTFGDRRGWRYIGWRNNGGRLYIAGKFYRARSVSVTLPVILQWAHIIIKDYRLALSAAVGTSVRWWPQNPKVASSNPPSEKFFFFFVSGWGMVVGVLVSRGVGILVSRGVGVLVTWDVGHLLTRDISRVRRI